MDQREVDILSAEVGLTPQALPAMKEKTREKLDRLQRKSAKPVDVRGKRVLRPAKDEAAGEARPGRAPRKGADERREGGRGTPVAERPSDTKKRQPRPAVELADRPARKPRPAGPDKRSPTGDGQRPGFGRKR
jgi:23S rRNA pseudouridine2605 synthase